MGDDSTSASRTDSDHDESDGAAASRLKVAQTRRKSILDEITGVGDMVLLDPLTEDKLVENLHLRYLSDEIYTYIGFVVISINPYKKLDLYTPERIQEYRSRNVYETKPHAYAIADAAYRWLRDKHQNQCIVITGESGAGKTEASKRVMQYVASVCGKEHEVNRVMQMLLQSNPLLEAFGNAKTTRNDNSSRFGKYMEIEFNFKGEPLGGEITNYLLEKSRVIAHAEGERNFHIFYQLLASAADSQLKSLRLSRNTDRFHYLRQAETTDGCSDDEPIGYDDKKDFKAVEQAMVTIGLKKQELRGIFKLVGAILHLGNITFSPVERQDEDEACIVQDREGLQNAGALLEGTVEVLEKALTEKTVDTLKEQVTVPLSVEKAQFARDALAKAIYSRLFNWLVEKVNSTIRVTPGGKRKSIGVLDIYGFEIFKVNSFEQFIINYCNEKLQHIFIETTLHQEQEEYQREGVKWEHIDFFDNVIVCDLIEKPGGGILSLLDDECLRPGEVSDMTFLRKLDQRCLKHSNYESRASKHLHSDRTLPRNGFRIHHYAGNVTYCVDGFIDKNKDLLHRDLSRAMWECEHPFAKIFFSEGDPENTSLKRPPTAATQFKTSIAELMKNLLSKNPNYIRCIKPNDVKKPNQFDAKLVRHQVRYLGLMENIRVRRAGYAFRQHYETTLDRYKMLAEKTWPKWKGPPRQGVIEILKAMKITNKAEYACGRTKVFIRNPRTLFDLEDQRRERLHDMATLIQKIFRGWLCRTQFLAMRWAANIFASNWKCVVQQRKYEKMRNATIVIQSYYRGWIERRAFYAVKYQMKCSWAMGIIVKYFHGWKVRKEYRKHFRRVAGPKIIRFVRTWLRRTFLIRLRNNLPSRSPVCAEWPACPPAFRDTSRILKDLYHRWRCNLYRQQFEGEPRRKTVFVEKMLASSTFKDRKACYPRSVAQPFRGDYLSLRTDSRWQQVSAATNDKHVVWSGQIMKIHRANGKAVPRCLVITTQAFAVLDPKTLRITHRVPLGELRAISVSEMKDTVAVFHVKQENSISESCRKGDFIFQVSQVIELVTKMKRVTQDVLRQALPVNIANRTELRFGSLRVQLVFQSSGQQLPAALCHRSGSQIEVLV